MFDWDDLRVFLMLARKESLSAAGRALRIDAATVGRRVARLEKSLGADLFLRSSQGYTLTQAGELFLTHAEATESAALAAGQAVTGARETISGLIRIGAPDGCATYLLPAVTSRILDENPDLEIQIVALPRVFNLSRREADLAVAVSPPGDGARLTVQKISDYRLSLASHPDYLRKSPPIEQRSDLRRHRLVGYIPDMIFDRQLDYLADLADDAPTLASNSAAVQLMWLASGAGVGIVHDFALPSAPDLVKVLPDAFSLTRSFWLIRHADDRSPRMTRFAEALMTGLKAEITRREGGPPIGG